MINSNVVSICEILNRTVQGVTQPFVCRGTNGKIYYVKGRHAGRKSQIAEWVCGCLANAYGLPVAPFSIVDVPSALVKILPPEWKEIGEGLAFGSQRIENTVEMNWSRRKHVPPELKQDLLMFDWWIKNEDRVLTAMSGNPNLLWSASASNMIIIDHNMAFDETFSPDVFLTSHIFSDCWNDVSGDWIAREWHQKRMAYALSHIEDIFDKMPDEWWHLGDGLLHGFTQEKVLTVLRNCESEKLWEFAK